MQIVQFLSTANLIKISSTSYELVENCCLEQKQGKQLVDEQEHHLVLMLRKFG
jgi:hypothetical protein